MTSEVKDPVNGLGSYPLVINFLLNFNALQREKIISFNADFLIAKVSNKKAVFIHKTGVATKCNACYTDNRVKKYENK